MFSFYLIMIYIEHAPYDSEWFTNQCKFIVLCHDHLSKTQRKEVRTIVGHVMNPETMDEELTSLVEYMKYKLLEWDNQKLEAQWAK
jgi:hypothetical protein